MNIITTQSEDSGILRQTAQDIAMPLTKDVIQDIERMRQFYKTIENKAGFAAPQVGLSQKIILIESALFNGEDSSEPIVLINPEWQPLNDQKSLDFEGCLSVPGKLGFVERYTDVMLTAYLYSPQTNDVSRIQNNYIREFSSVLWQHEIDHLHGTLYTDIAKLVIDEHDFHLLCSYLAHTEALHSQTDFFDQANLLYHLMQEYIHAKNHEMTLEAFLLDQLKR